MGRVFISYSSRDSETAFLVRKYLNDCCPVWMAPFSIPAGSNYAEEIPHAIEGSSVFLILLSSNSIGSKWVERELDHAIRFDLKVIPFLLGPCELSASFAFYLSNCQMIDASRDFAKALDTLKAFFKGSEEKERLVSWREKYCNAVIKKLHVSNTVFTLLDLEYSANSSDNLLELNNLLFEYEKLKSKQLDAVHLIQQTCRFIVHGRAGCGKTTLLQNLFYQTVRDTADRHELPVFLPMKSYVPGSLLSLEAIYRELELYTPGIVSLPEFTHYIRSHKLICFFDAYDEYELDDPEKRSELWNEIVKFSNQYDCSIVVSSRTEQMPDTPDYDYVFIKPFAEPQIVEFISKYFSYFNIKETADSFISRLSKGIRSVLHTPLIISMVVAVYIKRKQLPKDENQLYHMILRELLGFKSLLPKQVCSTDEKFLVISKVAFEMLLTGKAYFPFQTFILSLDEIIRKCGLCVDAFDLYKDLLHAGILETAGDRVFFFHTSVLEYLSRCEINKEYDFESKATMDQYFLKNSAKIAKIIHCISPKKSDDIIEVGAGIGTVSLAIPCYRSLTLVDLDEGLCKILNYNFRNHKEVSILQKDAIEVLTETACNKVISNLPFFLTNDVLNVLKEKDIDCAVMSIRYEDDISYYSKYFFITEVDVIEQDDFFPEQPFKSRIVKLTKKPE